MKLKIEWQYKTKNGATTELITEYMPVAQALLFYEDMMKTGRVGQIELIDEYDTSWILKEVKRYLQELEEEPHDVKLYFDAGYEREANLSGLGVAIYFKQNNKEYRIRQNARIEGYYSNNEAEYAALHFACQLLQELDIHGQDIEVFGDSQVVIRQMAGEWPVYEQTLESWANKIDVAFKSLKLKPQFIHVPRQQNGEANKLATQALQGVNINSKLKL